MNVTVTRPVPPPIEVVVTMTEIEARDLLAWLKSGHRSDWCDMGQSRTYLLLADHLKRELA